MVGSVREGAPPALARTAAAPLDTVPDDVAVFVTACARRDSCHALTSFLWVHHLTQIVRGGRAISTAMVTEFGLDLSGLALDMTNFATFIDSANDRARSPNAATPNKNETTYAWSGSPWS